MQVNKLTLGLLAATLSPLGAIAALNQDSDPAPQIVGGKESTPYSRPYQVALLFNGRQGCGGTLLNKDWVLTAAHCLDNASTSSLTVRVGAHSMRANDGQTIRVSQIISHENWRGANGIQSGYDIGLLRLASPASGEYTPAKLPTAEIEQAYAAVGRNVTVSGWGLTYNQGSPSDTLREVELPVISNSSCSSQLNYTIPGSVICGGGTGGVSACNGDSGGPFAVRVGNDYYSIGTVSWGIACKGATAFTRTASYVDWIKTKTGIGSDTGDNAPTANFTYTVSDLTVSFTSTSTDDKGISSYEWNFGDSLTSSAQNPTHSYQQANSYTVTLKVTDTKGQSHTTSKLVQVDDGTTLPGCSGTPEWSASRSYALNDVISYKGRKYQATWWSTGAQPDIYSNVWKDIGACSGDSNVDLPPVANFDYQASGLTVKFTNASTDDVGLSSVNWSFGDGTHSQSNEPSHTYTKAGTYTVALTVMDTKGQTNVLSKNITVSSTDNGCQTAAWSASLVYQTGDKASLNGKVYQAKWWVQGENPEQSGPWGPWALVGACN